MSSNMPISSSTQTLFVGQKNALNKAFEYNAKSTSTEIEKDDKNKAITLEVDLIKRGDVAAEKQADELFAQANSYSKVSAKVKQSLQAYESLEMSNKREAISNMMGIDLYA